MVQEANDIGTAYLRVDLLPADAQPALREKFRRYVDARIETYQLLPNLAAAEAAQARALQTQSEIWSQAVAATRDATSPQPTMLLLPALNQMIDITTTQIMAGRMHPPIVVFLMLGILALACSLLAGYDMPGGKRRSWIHTLAFAGIMGISVYVILDMEFPRLGLIRIDSFDQVLVDVRQSMK